MCGPPAWARGGRSAAPPPSRSRQVRRPRARRPAPSLAPARRCRRRARSARRAPRSRRPAARRGPPARAGPRSHQLEVGADRRDRGPQLSHASATSCGAGPRRGLQSVQRAVERPREPRRCVSPLDLEALIGPLRTTGDRLRAPGEPLDRRKRRARDEEAEQGGQRDTGGRDHRQQRQLAGQSVVDVRQRQRDPERTGVSDPGHEHPDRRPGNGHVGEVLPAAAADELFDRAVGRNAVALAGRHESAAASVEQRVDPRRTAERRAAEAVQGQALVALAGPLGVARAAFCGPPPGCGPPLPPRRRDHGGRHALRRQPAPTVSAATRRPGCEAASDRRRYAENATAITAIATANPAATPMRTRRLIRRPRPRGARSRRRGLCGSAAAPPRPRACAAGITDIHAQRVGAGAEVIARRTRS